VERYPFQPRRGGNYLVFLVDSEDQAVQAIGHLHELRQPSIRAIVNDRFTAQTMARGYLDAYSRLVESQRCGLAPG
jgi:hypothetical protein